jgi:hypothetical protein
MRLVCHLYASVRLYASWVGTLRNTHWTPQDQTRSNIAVSCSPMSATLVHTHGQARVVRGSACYRAQAKPHAQWFDSLVRAGAAEPSRSWLHIPDGLSQVQQPRVCDVADSPSLRDRLAGDPVLTDVAFQRAIGVHLIQAEKCGAELAPHAWC